MKKILLMAVLTLGSIAAMAQVDAFKGNLKEAIQKAKDENKKVMIVASTTWCGPCKYLANSVFTTKESGDYINPRFVVLKYNLDVADPDKIAETYKVKVYPTIIFLGGNGKEITRMVGGAKDAAGFNERLEKAFAPGATFVERKARYESDPSTMPEYVEALSKDFYMSEDAREIMNDFATTASIKDLFSTKLMKFHAENIYTIDNPTFKKMLDNKAEVIEVMGEDNYNDFVSKKAAQFISMVTFPRGKFNQENFNNTLNSINSNPILASDLSKFMQSNGKHFEAKNTDALIAAAKKSLKKADFNSKMMMINFIAYTVGRDNKDKYMPQFISLYEMVAKNEKNEDNKKSVNSLLESIKNPKGIPAARMM